MRSSYRPDLNSDWVRGFADRSSSIRSGAIILSGIDDKLLRLVSRLLRVLGVRNTVRRDSKGRTVVRVGSVAGLKAWHQQVGFSDPNKARKLDEMTKVRSKQ